MLTKLVKHLTLTISMICMVFFNLLAPYYLTNIFPKKGNKMTLGIQYNYMIASDVGVDLQQINQTGFKVIRINFFYDSNPTSIISNRTFLFYRVVQYYNFKIALIVGPNDVEFLDEYLSSWGKYISYVQVLNEPELLTSWAPGAFYLDEEIFTLARTIVEKVRAYNSAYNSTIKLYTNFSPAFLIRANLVKFFANFTDFLGLDVYMDSGLKFMPFIYNMLQKISGKRIIITEFGISEKDDVRQADFIISGLNFFKNFGIEECWIFYWEGEGYGIKDRLAQEKIKEWIMLNSPKT